MTAFNRQSTDWIQQAAAIPWRLDRAGEVTVALVTSRQQGRWIIPKGQIDHGETSAEAAARECREEAGLIGTVTDEIVGSFTYEKNGLACFVGVHLLHVQRELRTWEEQGFRQRAWHSGKDAFRLVSEPAVRELIAALGQLAREF